MIRKSYLADNEICLSWLTGQGFCRALSSYHITSQWVTSHHRFISVHFPSAEITLHVTSHCNLCGHVTSCDISRQFPSRCLRSHQFLPRLLSWPPVVSDCMRSHDKFVYVASKHPPQWTYFAIFMTLLAFIWQPGAYTPTFLPSCHRRLLFFLTHFGRLDNQCSLSKGDVNRLEKDPIIETFSLEGFFSMKI